ncbi:ROK family transcriptional regulator [Paraburkholderia bannensis]|uniref:ROK family transcriptional regulator n=1 Tax=Paraburkholderia bannensis TaxID=765414 RepID=UPI002ABE2D30|nr:ROK family transcriptional regulator [Paraburkholderia bannensis]
MNQSHRNASSSAPVTRGPAFVRQDNEWAIYQHLLSLAPASSPQLADSTGLSKVTVNAALANLERLGLVEQSGVREGNAGRAPRLYMPRARAGFVLAIDVGAAWVRGALADLTGQVSARVQLPTPADPSKLVGEIVAVQRALLAEQGIDADDVLASVFGSPGVFDAKDGRLHLAPNLPDWERADLVPALREALGAETVFENDINLAALGEQAHGIGRGVENFVFMSIGTGVGLGIVANGKLHRGAHGFAGEIAVLRPAPLLSALLPVQGVPSAEPGQDEATFESFAAAKGVVAHARRLGLAVSNAEAVFVAAQQGDDRALACVAEEARQLAWGLAAIIPVLDPALVVLGGGIGHSGTLLLPAIRAQLAAWLPIPVPELAISTTGTDAVLLGAIVQGVVLARVKAFERIGHEVRELPV